METWPKWIVHKWHFWVIFVAYSLIELLSYKDNSNIYYLIGLVIGTWIGAFIVYSVIWVIAWSLKDVKWKR